MARIRGAPAQTIRPWAPLPGVFAPRRAVHNSNWRQRRRPGALTTRPLSPKLVLAFVGVVIVVVVVVFVVFAAVLLVV